MFALMTFVIFLFEKSSVMSLKFVLFCGGRDGIPVLGATINRCEGIYSYSLRDLN